VAGSRLSDGPGSPALTPEQFREVMGHFASGVTVITTAHDGDLYGSTESAVSSLSLEPPMLLICVNTTSSTGRAIDSTGRFAVNILAEDHSELAVRFAMKHGDKFNGVEILPGLHGVPLLGDSIATLECMVSQTEIGGTHYVFLAEVQRARGHLGAPLAYFRGQFGRVEFAEDAAAARAIRERVLHRRIPIGEPLDLAALAEDVHAPRGPVYHAVAKLSAEGWVDHDADGEFLVPPVTHELLVESARSRVAIFVGAALSALPGAPEREIAELRRLIAVLRPHAETGVEAETWFSSRSAMIEHLIRMTRTGTVLLDAFNRADVPAQIHSFLSGEGAAYRVELSLIHAGYASIVDACIIADYGALVAIVRELLGNYDSLYSMARDRRPGDA
jgi:flavin reductase (DIM6/NTAB) family NADH-FMN oxidoreductase RutF/DNA-binding GntR family transcriptional regulator